MHPSDLAACMVAANSRQGGELARGLVACYALHANEIIANNARPPPVAEDVAVVATEPDVQQQQPDEHQQHDANTAADLQTQAHGSHHDASTTPQALSHTLPSKGVDHVRACRLILPKGRVSALRAVVEDRPSTVDANTLRMHRPNQHNPLFSVLVARGKMALVNNKNKNATKESIELYVNGGMTRVDVDTPQQDCVNRHKCLTSMLNTLKPSGACTMINDDFGGTKKRVYAVDTELA